MTTVYTPDGQAPPTPDYTLPQDVIDLVAVETVNNPFVASADNIAWLLLALFTQRSVANYGASPAETPTNNTTAINAAAAAAHAAGGGPLIVPNGEFEVNGALNIPRTVDLIFAPGAKIVQTHATADTLVFGDEARAGFQHVAGANIEAAATGNSGAILRDNDASSGGVVFTDPVINQDGFFSGQVSLVGFGVKAIFVRPNIVSGYIGGSWAFSGVSYETQGGTIVMAPAASSNLFSPVATGSFSGTYFRHVSTVGDVSFISTGSGSVVTVEGCRFYVNDDAAGAGTTAIEVDGGLLNVADNALENDATLYKLTSVAAAKSRLQLIPAQRIETAAGADVTLTIGVESFFVDAAKVAAPNVYGGDPLFMGQRCTLVLRNVSGGTWGGQPTFVDMFVEGTGLDGLENNDFITLSLVALDEGDDGVPVWVQSAAPGVIA